MRFQLLLRCFILMLASGVYGASADTAAVPTEARAQPEAREDTAAPGVRRGQRSEVKVLEEFVPDEEVSADKPVAFPVDI